MAAAAADVCRRVDAGSEVIGKAGHAPDEAVEQQLVVDAPPEIVHVIGEIRPELVVWDSAAVAKAFDQARELMFFGGLKFATKRRAYRRNPDGTSLPQPVIVAIDIADIRLV